MCQKIASLQLQSATDDQRRLLFISDSNRKSENNTKHKRLYYSTTFSFLAVPGVSESEE